MAPSARVDSLLLPFPAVGSFGRVREGKLPAGSDPRGHDCYSRLAPSLSRCSRAPFVQVPPLSLIRAACKPRTEPLSSGLRSARGPACATAYSEA